MPNLKGMVDPMTSARSNVSISLAALVRGSGQQSDGCWNPVREWPAPRRPHLYTSEM